MKTIILVSAAVLSFCAATISSGRPAEPGPTQNANMTILKLKGKEAELVDEVQYRPASREYRVQKGPAIIPYKASQVDYCIAPKPAGFDAVDEIKQLEAIVEKYDHRWWDVQAARKLIPLYNEKKEFNSSIQLYRKLSTQLLDETAAREMRRAFWVALLGAKQLTALDNDLKDAAAGSDRYICAWSYITRGMMYQEKGENKEALANGYLKTVAMFSDISDAKKEALTKAIDLMEKTGDSRVARLRKMSQ